MTKTSLAEKSVNVAARLSAMAAARPDAIAVAEPLACDRRGKRRYRHATFRELDQDSDRIARGLCRLGLVKGTRLALLVRPGIDFISLVFALLKAGAVAILIDPGMGRRNLIRCLADAEPEGFVAIPFVHAVRTLLRRRFPKARLNVTVGRRWFWGGVTLRNLRKKGTGPICRNGPKGASHKLDLSPFSTSADDPAAIIFTTGSTGPPKGVLYRHGNFDAQVDQIRDFYGIRPGEIDLPCFPLFGLFNCAMGVTAVIPDMDPSHPARVDPAKIVAAVHDWGVTQTFGSPAIWSRVGRYCRDHGVKLPTVRRVLSAGAPVPAEVLKWMKDCIHPEGEVHTPYGATEALPVASISADEVLGATAEQTRFGAGVCVGRSFSAVQWKVIRIVDGPIGSLDEVEPLPAGKIGELIVSGPVVTSQYVGQASCLSGRLEACPTAGKIHDGRSIWHRMGDAGYLDQRGRFWFCGRVAHRVLTADGPMYPVRCEAIFNQIPGIYRSALVGVGLPGQQRPVIVLEPLRNTRRHLAKRVGYALAYRILRPSACRILPSDILKHNLLDTARQIGQTSPLTHGIKDFLLHPALPVDVRHNAKIFREKLAVWAAEKLGDD